MGRECQYSYADLFEAIHGRTWNESERLQFESLTQPQRNAWVKEMARAADGAVSTEDRMGTDGQVYTAFWLRDR